MKQVSKNTPWLLLAGISAVLILIAKTDIFKPTIQFIQADQMNSWQMIVCLIFSIVGFRLTFTLLNRICKYYSNQFEATASGSSGNQSLNKPQRGGH